MPHAVTAAPKPRSPRPDEFVVCAQLRLSREDHDRLTRVASENQRSISSEVRFAMRRHLAQQEAALGLPSPVAGDA